MTINLAEQSIRLYVDGALPTTSIRVSLKNTLSNSYLWEEKSATATVYDEWFTFLIENEHYNEVNLEGYYILKVEYFKDDLWVLLKNYLVKCVSSTDDANWEYYESDNEENKLNIYNGE